MEMVLGARRVLDGVVRLLTTSAGIKASGASYLLFPESKAAGIARTLYYRPPLSNKVISAEAFESLSPVVFPDATKLDKKLSALAPKAAKRGRDDHDNSQANKPYMNSTTDGANRAMFEHNRYSQICGAA